MNSNNRVVGAVLISLLLLSGCSSGESRSNNEERSQSDQTQEDVESQQSELEVVDGEIPDFTGHTLYTSITAVRDAGFRYEVNGDDFHADDESSNTRAWTVTDQSPAAGAESKGSDMIELTVEKTG